MNASNPRTRENTPSTIRESQTQQTQLPPFRVIFLYQTRVTESTAAAVGLINVLSRLPSLWMTAKKRVNRIIPRSFYRTHTSSRPITKKYPTPKTRRTHTVAKYTIIVHQAFEANLIPPDSMHSSTNLWVGKQRWTMPPVSHQNPWPSHRRRGKSLT